MARGVYEALLDQIDRAVERRGVPHPHLRRVALSSWSAGYGAVGNILSCAAEQTRSTPS